MPLFLSAKYAMVSRLHGFAGTGSHSFGSQSTSSPISATASRYGRTTSRGDDNAMEVSGIVSVVDDHRQRRLVGPLGPGHPKIN